MQWFKRGQGNQQLTVETYRQTGSGDAAPKSPTREFDVNQRFSVRDRLKNRTKTEA